MDNKQRRKFLRRYEESPYCCWCGIETTLEGRATGKLLPNTATLEHLFSKYHPDREVPNTTGKRRHAVACYSCNHTRGRVEDLLRRELVYGHKVYLRDLIKFRMVDESYGKESRYISSDNYSGHYSLQPL